MQELRGGEQTDGVSAWWPVLTDGRQPVSEDPACRVAPRHARVHPPAGPWMNNSFCFSRLNRVGSDKKG